MKIIDSKVHIKSTASLAKEVDKEKELPDQDIEETIRANRKNRNDNKGSEKNGS